MHMLGLQQRGINITSESLPGNIPHLSLAGHNSIPTIHSRSCVELNSCILAVCTLLCVLSSSRILTGHPPENVKVIR
jgi:hypothetical protein